MAAPLTHQQHLSAFRILLLIIVTVQNVKVDGYEAAGKCPTLSANPLCPCFHFEDGIFLECPAATANTLRAVLELINGPIQSLNVYDLDRRITRLSADFFPDNAIIHHLQISHSNLEELTDNCLFAIKSRLESLSVISGKLTDIPQKAFTGMVSLLALDLEANQISDVPGYSFYGLHLVKLNLKGNVVTKISEYAFSSLEESLAELDLSENQLVDFPIVALMHLRSLRVLRLAWNEIETIQMDVSGNTAQILPALLILDFSSNNFQQLPANAFQSCVHLRTLSLYYNSIGFVDAMAFRNLFDLESLDLSHNRIVQLDTRTFRTNTRLRSIDLSHNHLHHIDNIFAALPNLQELFLAENNILEVVGESFNGTTALSVIYLQQNAIRRIDASALSQLTDLEQLHLSFNYLTNIPRGLFTSNTNLTSLSLDSNQIEEIPSETFASNPKLLQIRLQDNHLTYISQDVFQSLPVLLELHLQNNHIVGVEAGAFHTLNALQHVNLQGNQITHLDNVFMPGSEALLSLQLESNALETLHNHSLKGQLNIQIIWLSHNRFKSLSPTAFNDLVSIQRIYLKNNSITHISIGTFVQMSSLVFLDLSHNELSQIYSGMFDGCVAIEELYLNHNRIDSVQSKSFNGLKRLRILDLSFNRPLIQLNGDLFQVALPVRTLNLMNCSISTVIAGTFQHLNNMNELNLSGNQLNANSLERIEVPGLRQLRLSGNNFSDHLFDRALHGLPSLQTIHLDRCEITQLPKHIFSKTKNLLTIDLSHNQIESFSAESFQNLNVVKELDVSGNHLSALPYAALLNISTLETLTVDQNRIVTVDFSRLNGLSYLKELSLANNRISSLSGFSIGNLTQLQHVDISGNQLKVLSANFFHNSKLIRRFNLSGNRFTQSPNVAYNLPALSWLNLSGNPLERIHEQQLDLSNRYDTLEEIFISSTSLSSVSSKDFESFPGLLHLHCSNNPLRRIGAGSFAPLTQLITLDLSGNLLESLPQERLRGLHHLRTLNLTGNRLQDLQDFSQDLRSLQILDVSRNQVVTVGRMTFHHLSELLEIYLQGNRIVRVAAGAFNSLKKLKTLDLSENQLEWLPIDAFKLVETHIRSIGVEGNPLSCNCDTEELWNWLRDHPKFLLTDPQALALYCTAPREVQGKQFLQLNPVQFCGLPLVTTLAIRNIETDSVQVSWQSRNHSRIHSFRVVYHRLTDDDNTSLDKGMRIENVDGHRHTLNLTGLMSQSRYLVCVSAVGADADAGSLQAHPATSPVTHNYEQSSTKCAEVVTLSRRVPHDDILQNVIDLSRGGLSEFIAIGGVTSSDTEGVVQSIFTRRLGLIIGSCLGLVVFVVLVSVLGVLKVKKQQRTVTKREVDRLAEAAIAPAEFMSPYRQFSVTNGAGGDGGDVEPGFSGSGHPHFITSMNSMSLSS